ncbi:uncharacterized protein LOC142354813 [Convolutriloba macropyga]|uniref:uncharacterized protein LOC142354813 n=1 Tax=Convolutriloba macropyga TaxID=536237 RepID=UPI003F521266
MPLDRHDAACDGERCICPSGFKEVKVVKDSGEEVYECKECEDGLYGKNCEQSCKSRGHKCFSAYGLQHLTKDICDKEDGRCLCKAGFDPNFNCEKNCNDYHYSTAGSESCTHCSCDHLALCDNTNGRCQCGKYLAGDRCEQVVGTCPPGKSGAKCDIDCQCSAGENCTRMDEKECRCTPDDVIDEYCDRRPTTPVSTVPPSTSESSETQIVKVSSTHLEYLVMAAVLATGMLMGVSVIGCYKLCCRRGTYVKPPSKSGDIIYRVKDDMVFICVKNSKFKGQDPQVLIPSILDGSNVSTSNGAFSSCFDLNPYMDPASTSGRSRSYYKDAPGLAVQLEKNELTPEKKMTVQLPLMGKDHKMIPKVETIRNDYTDVNSYGPTRTSTTGGSSSGYRRPPLPSTPTGPDPRNQIPGPRPLSSGSSSSYGTPRKISLSPPSAPDDTYSEPPPRNNYGAANNDLYGYNGNGNFPALYGTSPNPNGAAHIQSDFSKPIDFAENYEPAGPSVYDADQPQDYYGTGQNQRANDFYNVSDDSAGLIQLKSRKS